MFETAVLAPPDPILNLSVAYREDSRPTKVNLGVGAYKTAEGHPLVLACVRKAEAELFQENLNKEYLPIAGDVQFCDAAMRLHFDEEADWFQNKAYFTAQTVGATGALNIAGQLLKRQGCSTIHLSNPTWANHKKVFTGVGLELVDYPYYNPESKSFDLEAMLEGIERIPAGDAILLHACCHNPTGCDPTPEEWRSISAAIKQRGLLPVMDMAYQGFGQDLEEDAFPVRLFAEEQDELMLCSSFSKNLGLYGERVGMLCIKTRSEDAAVRIGTQAQQAIRSTYSMPPLHGARIAAHIMRSPELRKVWLSELRNIRERMIEMRQTLVAGLMSKGGYLDFNFMRKQRGMFSFSGLTSEQVEHLKQDYGIYMTGNGRISVAGLNPSNIDYVVDAIIAVLA